MMSTFVRACFDRWVVATFLPLAALAGTLSCTRKPPDATPEGVVRELLDRIDRADEDPAEIRGVYELLSARARASLDERAARAAAATGRPMSGAQMIAPSRFALRFEPHQMHARVSGSESVVDVVGIDPATDRARVRCVLEDGHWRVDLALPPVNPLEFRPQGGT